MGNLIRIKTVGGPLELAVLSILAGEAMNSVAQTWVKCPVNRPGKLFSDTHRTGNEATSAPPLGSPICFQRVLTKDPGWT